MTARRVVADARVDAERQAVAGRLDRVEDARRARRPASARRAGSGRTPPAVERRRAVELDRYAARRRCRLGAARRPRTEDSACARASSRHGRRALLRVGVDDRADIGRGSAGSPSFSSRAAPAIISIIASATSSCTKSRRSAEQRWPAERKADVTTSSATCSGSAVASAIMALMPPVSAISGTIGPSLAASARLIARATSVEPVKATPATRGSATSAAPTRAVARRRDAARSAGTPASCSSRTASKAISGVCSAGLATTLLPATSAAAIWPMKMASGKFQG